jgi:hypothetical protein
MHPHSIVDVIRLKNIAQQLVRAVKLEFKSAKPWKDMLEEGGISVMHMRHKLAECSAQANVLICTSGCAIGHFRKNCPQTGEATCQVC